MPNYAYICNRCKHMWDEFNTYEDRLKTVCPFCESKKISFDYSKFNIRPTVFNEFTTENVYPFNKKTVTSKRKYKDAISKTAEKLGEQLICKAIDFETDRNNNKPSLNLKAKQ